MEKRRIAIRKGKWTYFVLAYDLITCECGTSNSHQELGTVNLGSGGSPDRTVKKSVITRAVSGPKCFRTELA